MHVTFDEFFILIDYTWLSMLFKNGGWLHTQRRPSYVLQEVPGSPTSPLLGPAMPWDIVNSQDYVNTDMSPFPWYAKSSPKTICR